MKHAAANGTTAKSEDPTIRILKIASCPSLSGRSTLTYHIGCKNCSPGKAEAGAIPEIQFRVYANTARGFFSKEWISSIAIQRMFEKIPASTPIASSSLNGIFHGKSVNTSGFLLAVLKAERLIAPMSDQRRYYQRVSSDAFVAEVKELMASSISLNADDKPGITKAGTKRAIQTGKPKKA